jgi:hypothetical protein
MHFGMDLVRGGVRTDVTDCRNLASNARMLGLLHDLSEEANQ